MFVHHLYEQEVELRGVGLVGRHQVGEYAQRQHRLVAYLEDPHLLYVFEAGVDGHVEVMRVLDLVLL